MNRHDRHVHITSLIFLPTKAMTYDNDIKIAPKINFVYSTKIDMMVSDDR